MAFCPFMTSNPCHIGGAVACLDSCALNVDGHCAINILARVSLQEAGVRIYPAFAQDQTKDGQPR